MSEEHHHHHNMKIQNSKERRKTDSFNRVMLYIMMYFHIVFFFCFFFNIVFIMVYIQFVCVFIKDMFLSSDVVLVNFIFNSCRLFC